MFTEDQNLCRCPAASALWKGSLQRHFCWLLFSGPCYNSSVSRPVTGMSALTPTSLPVPPITRTCAPSAQPVESPAPRPRSGMAGLPAHGLWPELSVATCSSHCSFVHTAPGYLCPSRHSKAVKPLWFGRTLTQYLVKVLAATLLTLLKHLAAQWSSPWNSTQSESVPTVVRDHSDVAANESYKWAAWLYHVWQFWYHRQFDTKKQINIRLELAWKYTYQLIQKLKTWSRASRPMTESCRYTTLVGCHFKKTLFLHGQSRFLPWVLGQLLVAAMKSTSDFLGVSHKE